MRVAENYAKGHNDCNIERRNILLVRQVAISIISKRATGLSSQSPASRRPRTGRMACPTVHATRTGRHELVGFDNAHDVPARGSRFKQRGESADHWHRTERDPGRPYEFKNAETLIDDLFDEVERVLRDRGIGLRVTRTEASRRTNETRQDSEPAITP
jgi:hypothetical protein